MKPITEERERVDSCAADLRLNAGVDSRPQPAELATAVPRCGPLVGFARSDGPRDEAVPRHPDRMARTAFGAAKAQARLFSRLARDLLLVSRVVGPGRGGLARASETITIENFDHGQAREESSSTDQATAGRSRLNRSTGE